VRDTEQKVDLSEGYISSKENNTGVCRWEWKWKKDVA
jgi:hypothetical protein